MLFSTEIKINLVISFFLLIFTITNKNINVQNLKQKNKIIMTENLTMLLSELAAKLGTTVEYLWGVMIAQAQVEIYTFIGVFIAFLLSIGVLILTIAGLNKYGLDDYGNPDTKGWGFIIFICISGVVVLTSLMVLISNFGDFITAISNPEYWALQEILKQI